MKYVIEHLEPRLHEWCLLEYNHIARIVGKENFVVTNISDKKISNITKNYYKKSFKNMNLKKACILDPYAKKTLDRDDGEIFDYLVFGGILGDNPPKKRTTAYFKNIKCERRNLGNKQMSTDTAVYVAKNITEGKKLSDFNFIDGVDIKLDKYLSVLLPFRYVIVKGKLLLPRGLIKFLKKQENLMVTSEY